MRKALHFPCSVIDESLDQIKGGDVVNLIAPSSTGKSGAVFRYLCRRYGFYMTCSSINERTTTIYTNDHLTQALQNQLRSESTQTEIYLWGDHYAALAILSRLCTLSVRLSQRDSLPPPEEFLQWQCSGLTNPMADLFRVLVELEYHKVSLELLYSLIGQATDNVAKLLSVEEPLPFFIDEAQVFSGKRCLNGMMVVTAQKTIRPNAILSLLIRSVLEMRSKTPEEKDWDSPVIIYGTGFSTPQLELIQSSIFNNSDRKFLKCGSASTLRRSSGRSRLGDG